MTPDDRFTDQHRAQMVDWHKADNPQAVETIMALKRIIKRDGYATFTQRLLSMGPVDELGAAARNALLDMAQALQRAIDARE